MSRTPEDEEFYAGYCDGLDRDAPEPSTNRSRCYRHSFAVARADRRGEPLRDVHERADLAERLDRAEREWGAYQFFMK
jgi:hypothetical protein